MEEISKMIFDLRGIVIYLCFLNITIGLVIAQFVAYLHRKEKSNARSHD